MVKWRINTLSPQEIAKYRQRSVRAINGLNYCKQNAHIIAQYEKVTDKYKTIADYMGLGQEGGNSYYNFFVPTNKNIVFLLRNANHNNLNPSLYDMHEQLGRPNKRFVIFFKNGNTFSDVPVVFQESEHHVIPYNVNALDNEASIIAYIDAIIKLFTEGKTTFPNLPIVTENKQHTNMNKKLIRLTESDLHRIVKESVNRILRESLEEKKDSVLKESYDVEYVRFEDIRKGILGCQGLRPSEKHALLKFWKKHEGLLWNFESFETFNMFVVAVDNECDYDACAWSETLEPPEGWTLKDVYYTTKHIINDIGYDNIDYNDYEEQLY